MRWKKRILVLLALAMVIGLFAWSLADAQNAEPRILVNGRDPGDEFTEYIEYKEEGVVLQFEIWTEDIGEADVVWYIDGSNVSNASRFYHTFSEPGEYLISVELDGDEVDTVTLIVENDNRGMFLATLGAGLAVGIAGMGAGIGIGIAGAAGAGAIAEQPEKFGKSLVFTALPQTQAIYGLLIAILLFLFTGIIGGEPVSLSVGLVAVGIGLSVGIAGLSAVGQGIAAAGGIATYSEREDLFGKGVVFSVLPETQAIYGLLIGILLLLFTGMLAGAPKDMLAGTTGYAIGLVAIGAGLSVGIAGLSAIGQGIAAGSGIATVAEDEKIFGRAMVFSVLPETQAIYGLLVAILLIVFSNMLGETTTVTLGMGVAAIGAGLAIGIAGVSGIGQGITAGSAIAAVSRREETFGKGMVFSVMSEISAIFGLLIAIFIILFLGFM